jgi:deaminated glutathione amidase
MPDLLRVACIQMTSGPEIAPNLRQAEKFIRQAAKKGAKLIATPENTDRIRVPAPDNIGTSFTQDAHPGVEFFANLAKELGVWLLIGSMGIKIKKDKLANRSFLFSDKGKLVGTYDKIHMFDVKLPTGESHKESNTIEPGKNIVVVKTPLAKIGMSICYDLRFSYLFRDLAKAGAQILTIPSAFTVPTGKAHWEILLRARAIETGSFILAPAQTGEHAGGRKTWGHAMIIGPWGEVLAQAENATGVITADLNLEEVAKVRAAIPALQHDRKYKKTI